MKAISARNEMAALARTPVLPEATLVGAVSAQLRRPRSRSATAGLLDSGRSESKIFYAETFVKGGWTVVLQPSGCSS